MLILPNAIIYSLIEFSKISVRILLKHYQQNLKLIQVTVHFETFQIFIKVFFYLISTILLLTFADSP